MSRIVRWILTLALLVGVYRETGPFTTAVLGLTLIAVECLSAVLRRIPRSRTTLLRVSIFPDWNRGADRRRMKVVPQAKGTQKWLVPVKSTCE